MNDEQKALKLAEAAIDAHCDGTMEDVARVLLPLVRDAARWQKAKKLMQPGAQHNGRTLNPKLLSGHLHANRVMYSILFRGWEPKHEDLDAAMDHARNRP